MQIREVDVQDDDQFHQFFRIMTDAETFERPEAAFWSERECAVMFRHEEPGEKWQSYAAFDDADDTTMVGIGCVVMTLHDNTDNAFLGVDVAPTMRRRGIGSAVLSFIEGVARESGRTVLLTESHLPFEARDSHPYRQFAEKRGYSLANVEVRRRLRLPIPEKQLQAWADEAAPHHTDYRIQTFVDDLPDELLESYCYLSNQLALDAPTGDIVFEAESMTPETFRIRVQKVKEQGRTMYETLALDRDGQAVAQSTLSVPQDDPSTVFQWGTLVRKDHRGHRLGLTTKVANLRAVQAAHPERERILTTNSEDNANMVDINVKLGFEPIELLVEWQRKPMPGAR
ncbi:MAG: GNAT family N-acetyltransferase [Nocardioidaceae bacterium]